jgi:hypothetical protein
VHSLQFIRLRRPVAVRLSARGNSKLSRKAETPDYFLRLDA